MLLSLSDVSPVLGRLLYGIGLGLSLRCGPMYLRETVTASHKDAATVSVKLSMVCGMIVSYIVGGILTNTLWGKHPRRE